MTGLTVSLVATEVVDLKERLWLVPGSPDINSCHIICIGKGFFDDCRSFHMWFVEPRRHKEAELT